MRRLSKKATSKIVRIVCTMTFAVISVAAIQAAAFGPPSPEQRAKMDAELRTACGADFQNFCPTAADPHAKFDCLRTNEANLSASCSALVAKIKAHRHPGPPPGETPPASDGSNSTSAN